MRNEALIALIVIAIIGIIAFVWLSNEPTDLDLDINQNATTTEQTATNTNQTDEDDLTDTWQTYESGQFDFIFSYPAEAEAEVEAGRAVVTYIGPDAIANSEITDGFMFGVRTEDVAEDMTIQEIAQEVFDTQTENVDVVASTSQTVVGNTAAYEFQVESQLGTTVTYVVFQATDGQAFVVDYTIEDPANRGYDTVIEQMLRSLQYEEMDDSTATTTS